MPHQARALHPHGGTYHVGNRGNNKKVIFHDDDDRRLFLHLIEQAKERYPFELHHYTLMDNHYHLSLRVGPVYGLAPVMKHVGQHYARWFNDKYGCVGYLWQNRYWHRDILNEHQLMSIGYYIELNAVRAGMAQDAADYEWSSYREHVDPSGADRRLVSSRRDLYAVSRSEYAAGLEEWRRCRDLREQELREAKIIGYSKRGPVPRSLDNLTM